MCSGQRQKMFLGQDGRLEVDFGVGVYGMCGV